MAVPYPGTEAKPRSQNDDHLAGLATRYIEQNLDQTVGWDEVRRHIEVQYGKTSAESARGLLLAVLDLEWTGAMQYDGDRFRRPGLPTDAKVAPLQEVADAVLALGWPRPKDGKRSRTIHECYLELGGRYRHCDVYWAMHGVLKGKRLACHRAYWSVLGDAAILADETLSVAKRAELEQIVEAELCDRYVASLPHHVEREYPLDNRRADIFDRKRQLIIEAKAYKDDVVALGAITQAMLYRTIANRDAEIVDRVAVLLPGEPSKLARQVARTHELDVDVIWWDGNTFRHEAFE
ncbi:hypothetical protein [Pengzhenrongella sicca]|uniref:Uncharacterized protein n=1 Tax=Pengzhenrongella sicca TaxID=2819238 RepID=A0A8A4ZDD4_9MICO|nr:hypothetical protein [Pengzhenrongella sicca]QTE28556.1 hypothetical protein J4E96_14450 [Pengzhenrongella sicca]